MPVDDGHANATPAKLVCQHQASRAGSNDKNIGHHVNLLLTHSASTKGQVPGHTPAVMTSWRKSNQIHAI
jgi:hypothetical protein